MEKKHCTGIGFITETLTEASRLEIACTNELVVEKESSFLQFSAMKLYDILL